MCQDTKHFTEIKSFFNKAAFLENSTFFQIIKMKFVSKIF